MAPIRRNFRRAPRKKKRYGIEQPLIKATDVEIPNAEMELGFFCMGEGGFNKRFISTGIEIGDRNASGVPYFRWPP